MQLFIDELVRQSSEIGMQVSTKKSKEMFVGWTLKDPPPSVTLSGETVKRVATFRLLGIHVSNDLKWAQHIQAISAKDAARLYFLKQQKRAGDGTDDLLCFYCSVIRPVLEYAYPVWHSSLTVALSRALESIQKRAMNIIFPDMDYKLSLIAARIDTLEERQEVLTKRFFRRAIMPESSCLHYLLPDKRDSDILNKFRCPKIFQPLTVNTEI